MTNRAFYGNIANSIKSLGIDSWLPPRLVISKAKEVTADFISKYNSSSRLLYKSNDVFSEIEGLELIQVPISECIEVFDCYKLMRTKEPLPAIFHTKFGPVIPQVTSMNIGQEYTPCFTAKQYKAISKREFKGNERYYFFIGSHLYIPIVSASQPSPETIRILAMFKDKFELFKYKQKVGVCEECKKENPCPKLMDFDIVIPDMIIDDVMKAITQELASIYLKVVPDSYPNLEDVSKNNQKDLQDRKITNS